MSMFISVEGIDGVGKSTSSKMLAEKEGYIKVPKRSEEYIDLIKSAKNYNANEVTLHFLYISGAVDQSKLIRNHLNNKSNVIVARWLATEVASHRFYCNKNNNSPLTIDYNRINVAQPDLSFLLLADDSVRLERMKKRGDMFENDKKSLDPKAQELFQKTIHEIHPGIVEINTSNMTLEEVVETMQSEIKKYKSSKEKPSFE